MSQHQIIDFRGFQSVKGNVKEMVIAVQCVNVVSSFRQPREGVLVYGHILLNASRARCLDQIRYRFRVLISKLKLD
jgi:hypothetical protein